MRNKSINVLIICYNQENLIGRTLDSILRQKDWGLQNIVVSDDCSTDQTWNVLMKYQQKYPDIIRPIHQEHNVGIYGNMEYVLNNRGEADLFLHTSGDDPILDGFFKSAQKFIEEKGIDTREAVGIYSDWKTIAPDGTETINRQNAILTGIQPWSLYLRGRATSRSLLVSESVLSRFTPIILDQGLNLAECMYDSQMHLNIDFAYYMPVVTTTYYSRIGISTRLGDTGYHTVMARKKLDYILVHYAKNNKDIERIKYGLVKCDFYEKPRIKHLFKMFYYYEKSMLPEIKESSLKTLRLFGSYTKYFLKNMFVR